MLPCAGRSYLLTELSSQALEVMRSSQDEEIYAIVLDSLLATLKRLLHWFSNRGDRVSAAQAFAGLQTIRELTSKPQSALDSVSDFFTVASKFEDLSSVFAANSTFPTDLDILRQLQRDDTGAFDELFEALVKWTDVSLQIIKTGSSSVDSTDLILFVDRVFLLVSRQYEGTHHSSSDESSEDDSNLSYDTDQLHLQLQLIAITLLMLHAKLCLDNGRARSSIIYLLSCRSRCIDCAKYLRSCRFLSRSDNAMQLDDMQSSSYERLAIAYSLLGIRRKAEDHSLMAVMKQKVLPAEQCQSVTKVVMQELLRCIEAQEGWHSLLYPLRTLMTTKARSSSKDKLAKLEVQMKSTISSVAQDENSNTKTNRVVSMANNAIACKYLHDSTNRSNFEYEYRHKNLSPWLQTTRHCDMYPDSRRNSTSTLLTGACAKMQLRGPICSQNVPSSNFSSPERQGRATKRPPTEKPLGPTSVPVCQLPKLTTSWG